jgi:hypothetical protein
MISRMTHFAGCGVLLGALLLGQAAPAAQQEAPRVEVGPELSLFQVKYWPMDKGVGGRVAVALTPRIAIETRARIFTNRPVPDVMRGGRTVQVFAGPKATFASRGRYSVYGVLLPGVIYFSRLVTNVDRDVVAVGPATHFALDMGLGAGVRLNRHWSAHADITGPLYAVRGFAHLSDFPPAAERGILLVDVNPSIERPFQVTAGVSYRAGAILRSVDAPERGSWLVGADAGVIAYAPYVAVGPDVIKARRVGAFVSRALTSWMDADGGADLLLRVDRGHSTNEGGRLAHAVAGVKVGRRFGRLGYFVKLRAGVRSHSEGLLAIPDRGRPVYGRIYRPSIDFGAVIESAVGRRLVWRTDVGDLMWFHPSVPIEIEGKRVHDYAMPMTHSIVVSSGIGWRFGRRR